MIERIDASPASEKRLRVALAQIAIDETDPVATEARCREAVARAKAEGCAFAVIGGDGAQCEAGGAVLVSSASCFGRGDAGGLDMAGLAACAAKNGKMVAVAGASGVRDGGKAIRTLDGASGVFTPDGAWHPVLPRFEPGFAIVDLSRPEALPPAQPLVDSFETKAIALRFGLKAFMERLGISRVVIGVSGGIDSAVASALYASLLPPEDILLLAMPGPYTSQTTRRLARELAENLGSRFAEIPIGESVELTCRQFAELKSEGPGGGIAGAWELSPFAVENVQARDRGSRILAAAASAFGGVASCNANKAEITIGYGTLHGDIFGWLSCLGDLWKGEVYSLGRFLNDAIFRRNVIPEGIFTIKPSAELSEAQAVEHGLGDPLNYPYHDRLFRFWVEEEATPEDCVRFFADGSLAGRIGYDGDLSKLFGSAGDFEADMRRWWRLYRGLATSKRIQAPPVLAVSPRAFGEFPELQRRISLN